jgi:integrase
MQWEQAVEIYLASRGRLAETTQRIDYERLGRLAETFAGRDIGTVTSLEVNRYQRKRLERVSSRTVNIEVGVLRRVMRAAGQWIRIADGVDTQPEPVGDIRCLSAGEKAKLWRAAESNARWLHAYLAGVVAANTTCRKVELRHVRRGDVDLAAETLSVRRTKGGTGGLRVIPLNAAAIAAFRRLLEWGERHGFTQADDWVFPGRDSGTHRRTRERPVNNWRSAWRSLTEAAGLKGLRFHDLRHQAITELRESGVPDAVVMRISGHKSSAMLDRYSHARMDVLRSAVGKLGPARETAGTGGRVSWTSGTAG